MDEERLEHQRLRNRLKQRRHKARFVSERKILKEQVANLSIMLTSCQQNPRLSSLPWQDVALALKEATSEALTTQAELQKKHRHLQQLAWSAMALATSLTRQNNIPTNLQSFSWERTSMPVDTTGRKLCLDWYTQHMYYNTDRMLSNGCFPSSGSVADVLVQDCGNNCVDVIGRVQVEYNIPLKAAYDALAKRIWGILGGDSMAFTSEYLDGNITSSIDEKMIYRRMAVSASDSRYYAAREFKTEDRVIFLLGNLAQDELHPKNHTWRPRKFWFVLERNGSERCRLRFMWYNGPYVVQDQIMEWKHHLALTEEEYSEKIGELSINQFQKYLNDKYSQDDLKMFAL
ncbi:hypothetical protein THRCLA_07270 [Thraustotheca clavata]|uniref:BZIP domain-containing protein n=1 Tax=Thraustotheca clavata TaxID=74557 RepID=A0A1V9ZER2_9STRA|nr:hypothetical protein THRCLA_07270 [Thraustotheca clavata]